MGHVSKYTGPDRKSDGEAGNGTQRRTQRRLGCQAIRRRPSRREPPVHRDNHNVIQRKGMKK